MGRKLPKIPLKANSISKAESGNNILWMMPLTTTFNFSLLVDLLQNGNNFTTTCKITINYCLKMVVEKCFNV